MIKTTVKYRVEVDWVYYESDDFALSVSSPHYDYESAIADYEKMCKERCVDNESKPAKVELYEYALTPTGRYKTHNKKLIMNLIRSNY